jgi:hypothetical protein
MFVRVRGEAPSGEHCMSCQPGPMAIWRLVSPPAGQLDVVHERDEDLVMDNDMRKQNPNRRAQDGDSWGGCARYRPYQCPARVADPGLE